MERIINMTPHVVTVVDDNGNIVMSIEPESTPARCQSSREVAFSIEGISVNITKFGRIENLPEPEKGRWIVVSRIVAEAAKRDDLIVPDETVRDNEGKILGCKSFATFRVV